MSYFVSSHLHVNGSRLRAAFLCGLNRSMQHLIFRHREEDVENEAKIEDLFHRRPKALMWDRWKKGEH